MEKLVVCMHDALFFCPGIFAPFLNGHNLNGNDSDSDEFSDTLEQVNEVCIII